MRINRIARVMGRAMLDNEELVRMSHDGGVTVLKAGNEEELVDALWGVAVYDRGDEYEVGEYDAVYVVRSDDRTLHRVTRNPASSYRISRI